MAQPTLHPVDNPGVAPLRISPRLRSQLVYFQASTGAPGTPAMGVNEFYFDPAEVAKWLDDGVIFLVSPLDTANMTEVELSEEQESLLTWLQQHGVRHVRLAE